MSYVEWNEPSRRAVVRVMETNVPQTPYRGFLIYADGSFCVAEWSAKHRTWLSVLPHETTLEHGEFERGRLFLEGPTTPTTDNIRDAVIEAVQTIEKSLYMSILEQGIK